MKNSDKHEKIIRAAVKVFAKKGFFSARISDIAKAAKVAWSVEVSHCFGAQVIYTRLELAQ